MTAQLIKTHGTWRDVANLANTTIGKDDGEKEPSSAWKRKILLAEHSPIRALVFEIELFDLKSWVSVHLVRHKIGIEHFVRSQRTDRTGIDRDSLTQDSLVNHRMLINAQALINISRKRLCKCASVETRIAWGSVIETLKDKEPEIYSACVPDCVYRGACFEMKPCGYFGSGIFTVWRENYLPANTTTGQNVI